MAKMKIGSADLWVKKKDNTKIVLLTFLQFLKQITLIPHTDLKNSQDSISM